MGTWNFGSPQVTDGVKAIRVCFCEDNSEHCFCYQELEEYLAIIEQRFSAIVGSLEYKINKDYGLLLQLESIEVIKEVGYYRDIAFDYDSDFEVVISIFRNDGENLPNMDCDDNHEEFKRMLSETELPLHYQEELLDIVEMNQDAITMCGDSLSPTDKEFFDSLLRNHANAVIPTSRTAGWCPGDYETEVRKPTVEKNASWDAYCEIPKDK